MVLRQNGGNMNVHGHKYNSLRKRVLQNKFEKNDVIREKVNSITQESSVSHNFSTVFSYLKTSLYDYNFPWTLLTTSLLSIDNADWSKLHDMFKAREVTINSR